MADLVGLRTQAVSKGSPAYSDFINLRNWAVSVGMPGFADLVNTYNWLVAYSVTPARAPSALTAPTASSPA
jgi:hypothetical protein